MMVVFLMLSVTHYTQNDAGIIGWSLYQSVTEIQCYGFPNLVRE